MPPEPEQATAGELGSGIADAARCVDCPLIDGASFRTSSGDTWARHWLEHRAAGHVLESSVIEYRWTSPS